MRKQYKLDEIALKNLIHDIMFPVDSNNEIELITYYSKYNTTNLIIYNNFSASTCHLSTTNVVNEFTYPQREIFYNKISSNIGLARRLTLHQSNPSSIFHPIKTHSCPSSKYGKNLTEVTSILHTHTRTQKTRQNKRLKFYI